MNSNVEQRCIRCDGLGSSIPSGDFTKYVESIIYGLVLYDNFLHAEKNKSGQNVIILQNRKDMKLSSWNTQRSVENCIETCPRCINKKLLKNISTLGKGKTLDVCSNCGIKIQTDPSHCKCNVIFEKFLTSSAKDLDIDGHNNIKTCLSKPNRFTEGFFKNEAENNRLKPQTHPYSDSYLNRGLKKYYGQKSSRKLTDGHQVKIRPLFQSEIDLSKLYITRTFHSFLQEQKANSAGEKASSTLGFCKTRIRIAKQPHDQTFQFDFIFPSEKKDLVSRLQVSSSLLLHDIQANRKTNILEKKNFSVKTQTLWKRDFSISSLQGKSTEFLHDIHAKYKEMKTLEDQILEERRTKDLEMANHGTKTTKQTLPWQRDFSLFSLEGKALEVLHDIRAKYIEIKILEDKILDLGKENLGEKSDKQLLPWERDFSVLGLEGNSLELLHDIRAKYMEKKIQEDKILDLGKKNLGEKSDKQILPWERDFSVLGLEGNSLELLQYIRGKYRKTKILENKILAERRNGDLEIKNLGAKTNKQTLPWQRDSSLLSLKENSLELLNDIQVKYENKKRQLEFIMDLEKKSLETKTKNHRFSWQKNYSLLKLEAKHEENPKRSEEKRNRDIEKKVPGVKTKKNELPWQKDSSLLSIEGKYGKKKRRLEDQLSRDLERTESKNLGATTKKHGLRQQKDSSLLSIEGKYRKKIKRLEDQFSRDLERTESKNLGATTKKHGLRRQKDSSLLSIEEKYGKKKRRLEDQLSRGLERTESKNLGATTKKHGLRRQKDSSLSSIEGKYGKKKRRLEDQLSRGLERTESKNLGATTKKHGLRRQKDSSLSSIEGKYGKKKRRLEDQLSRGLERTESKNLGATTKKHGLRRQKDSSLSSIEGKYGKKKRRLEDQLSRGLERTESKNLGATTKKHGLRRQKDSSLSSIEGKYGNKKRRLEDQLSRGLERTESKNLGATSKKHELRRQKDSSLLSIEGKYGKKKRRLEDQLSRRIERTDSKNLGATSKKHGLRRQKDSSLSSIEGKYGKKQRRLEDQLSRGLERTESKNLGATSKKHGLRRQKDSSLSSIEGKYGKKQRRLEDQLSRGLERTESKNLGATSKKHGLRRQKDSSLSSIEGKYGKKKRRLEDQLSRGLERTESKNLGATSKKHGLRRQKDSSLLSIEGKYGKKKRRLEDQLSRRIERTDSKNLGATSKKHGLRRQKDSSLSSIEGKYGNKKRRLENQLSRDLERTESKNLGAATKKHGLPWQKKDSAHLNLEEETATHTQQNVKEEQSKRYKKNRVLVKKEDSYNELNDSNSEINVRLVKKTSKEIEERRKKNQSVLEMLISMHKNDIRGTNLTMQQRLLDTDWTKLATQKAVRKMFVYPMVLSRPEFDWFAKNKDKRKMFYDTGETLAEFSENDRGRWFYRDGKLALDYYNTEKTPPGRRYVVYSTGEPDSKGYPRPQTILASFDHSGNGVVFDHAGNVRLKYDQKEGILLDHSIGPMSHWKWHSLKDPPATTDTDMPFKDPEIQMSEKDGLRKGNEPTHKQRVHKLEIKKTIHETSKKMTQSYKRFEIKMKALIINEHFSLKILDQTKVYLLYRDDTTHIKINIGMTMNRIDLATIETCNVDDVFNPLEKFPADTQSVVELQRMLAQARHAERARVRHQYHLMRPLFVC